MKKFTMDEILEMDHEEFVKRWNDNSIQASCLEELGYPNQGPFDETEEH